MKQTLKLSIVLLVFGVLSFCLSTSPAYAYDSSFLKDNQTVKNAREAENKGGENRAQKAATKNTDRTIAKSSDTVAHQNRLTTNQIKKCEKKQKEISNKLDIISARGAKQLEVFHTIATRVENFYIQKGYTADGYDTLVTELDTLYDQSLVAVTSTQNAGDAWSCNLQDPIASLKNFKDAKRAETATLKSYKDKVHELILLVKRAGGTN
ncbi:hypothetical protein H7Y29_01470 [Microbacteriaceae bacterium]|nr:hypothetical protein [Candidatus Saccharibacteria bacterium]